MIMMMSIETNHASFVARSQVANGIEEHAQADRATANISIGQSLLEPHICVFFLFSRLKKSKIKMVHKRDLMSLLSTEIFENQQHETRKFQQKSRVLAGIGRLIVSSLLD